jgi:hypothetical protein
LALFYCKSIASNPSPITSRACSFGWLLVAGADLFCEKSTAGWLLVAGLF